jgi:hypothetical protein
MSQMQCCMKVYIFEEETPPPKPCPAAPSKHPHSHTDSSSRRGLHDDAISLATVKPRISGDRFLHWSLKQKLHAGDCNAPTKDDMELAFDKSRLVMTAKNYNTDAGQIYMYETVVRSLASCLASQPKATSLLEATGHDPSCTPPTIDCRSEQFALRTIISGSASQYLGSAVAIHGEVLVVSSVSNSGTVYVYERIDATSWTLAQTITNPNIAGVNNFGVHAVGISGNNEIMAASLTGATPAASGLTNLYTFNLDSSWYCVVIAMYDLFGDGWSGARLKITASTGSYTHYSPRGYRKGFSQNPAYVRYCPGDWELATTYSAVDIEIPDALDFPHHWEIKWMVYFENSKQWRIIGNHATKAKVDYLQNMQVERVDHPYNHTQKCDDHCQGLLSTQAPTRAPVKPPPPSKARPGVQERDVPPPRLSSSSLSSSSSSSQRTSLHTSGERVGSELTAATEDATEDAADLATDLPIPSMTSAAAPQPRRSLHLRTSSPSMSPAPTFVQADLTYAYPWITLQDSAKTGWWKGEDTGTQWFLSSNEGMKLLGTGTLCDTSGEKVCKLVSLMCCMYVCV